MLYCGTLFFIWSMPVLRVAVGGLWHETNTFAAEPTSLEDFLHYQFAEGAEILEKFRGTRTEIGGFLSWGEEKGWKIVPTLHAAAVPSGVVTASTFAALSDGLSRPLVRDLDGVLLSLHGAMVSDAVEDCEAEILRRVRDIVGPKVPVAATFDIHANLSYEVAEGADLLIGYDTYPHVDFFERGREAARWLEEFAHSGKRPAKAFRKLPLLTVPQSQATDSSPMKEVMAALHTRESQPGMVCSSVAVGFPYSDVERAGVSVLAYAVQSQELASLCADEIAQMLWSNRQSFAVQNVSPEEAAVRTRSAAHGPVILVDTADNIGGGAPGDGTAMLRALLDADVANAVVTLADAEAVQQAVTAGVGTELELVMGGKHDRRHGSPVRAQVKVLRVTNGGYTYSGSYMTGLKVNPGKTAVVSCQGVEIVLNEHKVMPFDSGQLRSSGIDPRQKHAIVVKSAIAWKAAYGNVAKEVIYVDTPGICSANLLQFDYRRVPRPAYPLDEI